MEIDKEEMLRRRKYEVALAASKRAEEKAATLKRATRSAKSRLLATTKSEKWHRMTLAWLEREVGYTGEMASARVWLRHQPIREYGHLLAPFAQNLPAATNIEIEVAAVKANFEDWNAKGNALLLDRAKRAYAAELESFRAWQRENPDKLGWRKKSATRAQGFLINRLAIAVGIELPSRLNRGDAHDWIVHNGGNPRLEPATHERPPQSPPHEDGMGAP